MAKVSKIDKVIMDIYKEMYKVASPPADLDEIIKSGEGKEPFFFDKYYLDTDTQTAIIEKHSKSNKLRGWEKRIISTRVLLGAAPNCSKQKVNEYRKQLSLKTI